MEAEGGGGGYRPHLDPRRVNIFNPIYASQNILDESILFAIMIKYFKLQKQQRINGSKKGFSFHFFFSFIASKIFPRTPITGILLDARMPIKKLHLDLI